MNKYYLPLLSILFLLQDLCLQAQVSKVEAIGITVHDMERSVKFYSEVLGFRQISEEEFTGNEYEKLENVFGLHVRIVRMKLGDEILELTDYLTSGGRSIPEDVQPNDLSFQHIAIVVNDMEKAYARLRKNHVEHVSTAPQTLPATIAAAAGIKAFYFHDPDKHTLELIYFPKDKGQSKWHRSTKGKLFLGIDHTAIGISNTNNSLLLYQTILGIERKGESFNFGMEQEHLNNVEGASLHITGLRAAAGPGIEFLQYLQPAAGKPYPDDTKANDIWYWQTTLMVNNAASLYAQLKEKGYQFISKEICHIKGHNGKSFASFIVRDSDKHALLIEELQHGN
jgi:catechol 2,3-dioxygenase-like lactoylglutathione lyase family enzyme